MLECPVRSCGYPSMTKASMVNHLRVAHEYDEEEIEAFKYSFESVDFAIREQTDKAFEERKYGVLEPYNFVPTMRNGKSYIVWSKLHPGYCIRFGFFGSSANMQTWKCTSCVSAKWKNKGHAHTAHSREDVWITDPDGGNHSCDWPANEHKELEMYKDVTLYIVKREAKKTGIPNVREALMSAIMDLHSAPELSRFTKEEIAAIQLHQRMRPPLSHFRKRKAQKAWAAENSSERTFEDRSESRSPMAEMGVSAMDIILGSEDKPESIQLESETSMVPSFSDHNSLDNLREELVKEQINICKMKLKREAQELKNEEEFHAMRMRTERIKQEMYLKKMRTDGDL